MSKLYNVVSHVSYTSGISKQNYICLHDIIKRKKSVIIFTL